MSRYSRNCNPDILFAGQLHAQCDCYGLLGKHLFGRKRNRRSIDLADYRAVRFLAYVSQVRALAALRRSAAFTQSMPPYRPPPAQKACTEVMLIFASASLLAISAMTPGRSSPWIRKPLFFLLSISPADLAAFAKAALSSGMRSNWDLREPCGKADTPCRLIPA